MNDISLFQAWSLWFDGETLSSHYSLWKVDILWWGRYGKVVGLVSALTILAEIIGPERLRDFGISLHGKISFKKLLHINKEEYYSISLFYSGYGKEFFTTTPIGCLSSVIIIGILVYMGYGYKVSTDLSTLLNYDVLLINVLKYIILPFAAIIITPFISAIIFATPFLFILLIDFLIIEPLAWMMGRSISERWLKFFSLFFLIIGFHFDLLAS